MIPATTNGTGGKPHIVLSRGSFIAAVVIIAALAGTAPSLSGTESVESVLAGSLALNKVLWLCLGIGVWHLVRRKTPSVAAGDLALGLPALVLAVSATGVWPWIGLAASLLLWSRRLPSGAARTGLLLALATAMHEVSIDVIGELVGDMLLGIDAQIAALLSPLLLQALAVSGTALQGGDGHTLVLVWGCSSLSALGESLLLCWALTSLHPGAVLPGGMRRLVACLVCLALLVIVLNATRLTIMASSMEAYWFIHDEGGAALFRMGILALAAIISGVYVHGTSRRLARVR